jgi:4-hydroxybenzoate polyprenyltransferase
MGDEGKMGGLVLFDQVHLPVLLVPIGPFYIGWILAAGRLLPTEWSFLWGLLSILPFLGMGTVLLNDAFDIGVDRLSGRKGGLASSRDRVEKRTLVIIAGISLSISLALAMVVSSDFALVMALLILFTLLYSVPPVHLSRRPGIDILANVLGIGVLCTVAGWVMAAPDTLPPTIWLLTTALGTGTFFLLPALMDYESDRQGGKMTVAGALGWKGACVLGTALISMADVGIVYMSLSSIVLGPSFLWIAWPIILGEVIIFPVLVRRPDLIRQMTGAMAGLLFIGNLAIVLSYLDLLGPF